MGDGEIVRYEAPGLPTDYQANTPAMQEHWDKAHADVYLKGADVVASFLQMGIHHGNVSAEIRKMEAASASGWEATHQKIALLDAETQSKLVSLKAQLAESQTQHDKFTNLLDFLSINGPTLQPEVAAGVGIALANLTAPPKAP